MIETQVFFHLSTVIQRNRAIIQGLRNDNGEWVWDHNQLKQLVHSYFIVVYLNNDINHDGQNKILTGHFQIIKQSQRDFSNQRVSKEEIKEAIFGMAPFKAPGPNGFHAGFYQKMWHVVGPSVCDVV